MNQRVRTLADGHDDFIHFQHIVAVFDGNRGTTAGSIRFAQFHLNAFQTGDPALFVADNAYRIVQQAELDAFFFGVSYFFLTGRQFIFTATVYDVHVFRA